MMFRPEKTLVVLLRLSAVVLLVAVIPAVMPFSWMIAIHRQLGMGALPREPIVSYLTRSLSGLYAAHGALLWCVSLDVRRYLPLVKCFGAISIVFGVGLLILDVAVGLPLPWISCEGPMIIVFYGLVLWLARRVPDSSARGKNE